MRIGLYQSAVADNGKPLVVLVDDEEQVLESLRLQLGRDYRLLTATSGGQALALLAEHGPAAAVVSDMRMPGMNGIELLHRVQREHPAATRVLHTGYGDVATAVAAINSGGVYRYLVKPADTETLRAAIRDSVRANAETVDDLQRLDRTLRSSVRALFGVLELSNPTAYQRAGRISALVTKLCDLLELGGRWEIEAAAMASQLGAVAVPADTMSRLDRGLPLSAEEQAAVDDMPRIALRLLGDIPEMWEVLHIIRGLTEPVEERSALVADGTAVLRTAIGFEALHTRGVAAAEAIRALEERPDQAPHVLAALRRLMGIRAASDLIRTVRVVELEVGMRLLEEVVAVNGLVLIGRDTVLTELMLDRLVTFGRAIELVETVLAAVPDRRVPIRRESPLGARP